MAIRRLLRRGTGFVVVTMVLAACSGSAPASAPASTAVTATPTIVIEPSTAPTAAATTAILEATPTMSNVTVGGLQIAGHCSGPVTDRPTIVLMHGNGGSGRQFDYVRSHLETLSRVCDYDRPGAGNSAAPPTLPRSITEVVAEAHGVIKAAGIKTPVFLLGTSEGGAVAFLYAQAYPDEVAGFVSINPNPPYDAWIAEAKKIETPEEVATLEEPDYRGENSERIDNRANSSMLTNPLPATMPYAMMFDEDCGGDTAFCARVAGPIGAVTERLAKVGASGRYVPVPGAGHTIEISRPDAVNKVVDEVWSKIGS